MPHRSNIIYCEKRGVQEYRNCTCGSTLLLITDDRRDKTEFGEIRRILFDLSVTYIKEFHLKINENSTEPTDEEIVEFVRHVFRKIILQTHFKDSIDFLINSNQK